MISRIRQVYGCSSIVNGDIFNRQTKGCVDSALIKFGQGSTNSGFNATKIARTNDHVANRRAILAAHWYACANVNDFSGIGNFVNSSEMNCAEMLGIRIDFLQNND